MGSLISGIGSAIGAGAASRKADAASSILSNRYDTTRGDLTPYIQGGDLAMPQVNALLQGGNMQDTLRRMPGYQFSLDQGLKATQAAAAARGLGVSGAALKGAATYATGLADNTYQQMFKDTLDTANLGAQSAAQLGSIGANLGANQANALMNAGLAQAQQIAAPFKGIGDTVNQGIGAFMNANPNFLQLGGTTGYQKPGLGGGGSAPL